MQAFLDRLNAHIQTYQLTSFELSLHGGEPLLFGKRKFIELLSGLHNIAQKRHCHLLYAVTTNGVLIDDEWAHIFKYYQVQVCISIDGPAEIHDQYRVDLRGRGTYDRTIAGIETLRRHNIEPTIISVCDPTSSPAPLLHTLVDALQFKTIDVLIRDADHTEEAQPIANYYIALIDLWLDHYLQKDVTVRIIEGMISGLLGKKSATQSIGTTSVDTVVLNPDGTLEPLDVLRQSGHALTKTNLNIQTDSLQSIVKHPLWQHVFQASTSLCAQCNACDLKQACGGGDLTQRYDPQNGYDNPSVYCADYKLIFAHLKKRLSTMTHRKEFASDPL